MKLRDRDNSSSKTRNNSSSKAEESTSKRDSISKNDVKTSLKDWI